MASGFFWLYNNSGFFSVYWLIFRSRMRHFLSITRATSCYNCRCPTSRSSIPERSCPISCPTWWSMPWWDSPIRWTVTSFRFSNWISWKRSSLFVQVILSSLSFDCSIDWLIRRSIDCSFDRVIDWLIDRGSIDCLIGWLIHWSIDRWIDWLIAGIIDWLIDWLIDCKNDEFLSIWTIGGFTDREGLEDRKTVTRLRRILHEALFHSFRRRQSPSPEEMFQKVGCLLPQLARVRELHKKHIAPIDVSKESGWRQDQLELSSITHAWHTTSPRLYSKSFPFSFLLHYYIQISWWTSELDSNILSMQSNWISNPFFLIILNTTVLNSRPDEIARLSPQENDSHSRPLTVTVTLDRIFLLSLKAFIFPHFLFHRGIVVVFQ